MRERGVGGPCVGNAVQQLARADGQLLALLGEQTLIGGRIELVQISEHVGRESERFERSVPGVSRDQPVRASTGELDE